MVYVTVVRHGQTPCNIAGICQTRKDGELTFRGQEMAKSLGENILKNEKFTHIFSSDLGRCRETTANILSKMEVEVPDVQFEPRLRERDFGDYEMKSTQLVIDKLIEMNIATYKSHQVDVVNGETYDDVKRRCADFFSDVFKITDADDSANILVVTHGCFICIFVEYLCRNPDLFEVIGLEEDMIRTKGVENTCRTRFSISKKSNEENKKVLDFTHVFDISHLE